MTQIKVDDQKVIEIYNQSGSRDALKYLKDVCHIKNPSATLYRIRNNESYGFNKEKDCFISKSEQFHFIELDELCGEKKPENDSLENTKQVKKPRIKIQAKSYDQLLQQLVKEKLLDYVQYVELDSTTKICRVNKQALIASGYQLEVY